MDKTSIFYNLKYGYRAFLIPLILIIIYYYSRYKILLYISIIFIISILFLYRNNYTHHRQEEYFIASATSRITNIEKKNKYNVISSYISPINKHFMIAPVDCIIINIERKLMKNSDAERLTVTFKSTKGHIFKISQVIGKFGFIGYILKILYKNRCIVFNKIGDKLKQGERYGLIRFGSKLDYFLPKKFKLLVKKQIKYHLGDKIALIN